MLGLEPEIKERLAGALPQGVRVTSAADLAGARELSQFAPAVHVMYEGYKVAETHANGMVTILRQSWLTVLLVRNARNQRDGAAARTDAGPLALAVYQALAGWVPAGGCGPMTLANGPAAGFENGVFFMPLAWSAAVQLTNETDDGFPLLKRVTADYGPFGTEEIPA